MAYSTSLMRMNGIKGLVVSISIANLANLLRERLNMCMSTLINLPSALPMKSNIVGTYRWRGKSRIRTHITIHAGASAFDLKVGNQSQTNRFRPKIFYGPPGNESAHFLPPARQMLTLALSLIPFHSTSTSKPLLGGCRMDQRSSRVVARVSSHPLAPPKDVNEGAAVVSLSEWQGWGTLSPVPAMVNQVVREMTELETECGEKMMFGGLGGKLQGNIKLQEDKKHRAVYQSLQDSETKLQFFSARQIACRLLGSRGYLCQKCWLAMEDCMCSKVQACSLWNQIRFWVYMHPKDFLRQNNTGKLLWQIFGTEAASLCLFGIPELEVIMWNALQTAGKGKVWLLYPCKDATANFATDIFVHRPMTGIEGHQSQEKECIHFILIDGTWSNSTAMFSRLKTHGESIWGEDGIPCISLTTLGTSAMHTLRPQPSWDKTCTAAAAIGLLSELSTCPALSNIELNKQADAVKNTLEVLLEALTARRQRMGRSVTRKERSTLC